MPARKTTNTSASVSRIRPKPQRRRRGGRDGGESSSAGRRGGSWRGGAGAYCRSSSRVPIGRVRSSYGLWPRPGSGIICARWWSRDRPPGRGGGIRRPPSSPRYVITHHPIPIRTNVSSSVHRTSPEGGRAAPGRGCPAKLPVGRFVAELVDLEVPGAEPGLGIGQVELPHPAEDVVEPEPGDVGPAVQEPFAPQP